jgi:predicted NBD/HSP70 family sugar kinase
MIITVDTGGTKTLIAGRTGNNFGHARHRFATPKDTNEYISLLAKTFTEQFETDNVEAIAIAVPGLIKGERVVYCPNIDPSWNNFALVASLRKKLSSSVPIFLQNDANMAGLGETHSLAHSPKTSLYVTISTGIGISATQNGRLFNGLQLSEGGHMLLEYDGILREWESFASGRAIYTTYGKYARDIHDEATWQQIVDKISRGFLVFIPLLEPDTIIIGGSIGTYFDRYGQTLKKVLDQKLPPNIPHPEIVQAKHPEEAVIYGCYHYAKQQLSH